MCYATEIRLIILSVAIRLCLFLNKHRIIAEPLLLSSALQSAFRLLAKIEQATNKENNNKGGIYILKLLEGTPVESQMS